MIDAISPLQLHSFLQSFESHLLEMHSVPLFVESSTPTRSKVHTIVTTKNRVVATDQIQEP